MLQQQAEHLHEEKKVLEEIREGLDAENAELRLRAEALAESAENLLAEKFSVQNKVRLNCCVKPPNAFAFSAGRDHKCALRMTSSALKR